MDDESRTGAAPMIEDEAAELPETPEAEADPSPEGPEDRAESSEAAPEETPEASAQAAADGPAEEPADGPPEGAEGGEGPEASAEPAADEDEEAPEDPRRPAREVTDEELEREVSALLLASPDPLSVGRLRKFLDVPKLRIETALGALSTRLAEAGLPWELRAIGGGWQLYTTPDMVDTVQVLAKVKKEEKVSPAALETLAVVAYRQPVTKAEIEAIRGVQVGPVLRTLVDRGLLKVAGRAEVPGSPLLYGTTKKFLDAFGLMQLEDLPRDAELMKD